MGSQSHIEWTDATWNVARGCHKVDSDCKFCYMYRDSFDGTRYNPREVVKTKTVFNLPDKLEQPSKIFMSSLTDWALEEIDEYRHEIFEIIKRHPEHQIQSLTKRPERLPKILPANFDEAMPNLWLGTSIGSQESISRFTDLIRLKLIGKKFISFLSLEPLHGEINLHLKRRISAYAGEKRIDGDLLDWVIIGGESGNETGKYRYRECKIEWIEKLIDQCQEAGIPVFVKQLGTYLAKKMKLKDRHGRDINEWPEHIRIRQFPKTRTTL